MRVGPLERECGYEEQFCLAPLDGIDQVGNSGWSHAVPSHFV